MARRWPVWAVAAAVGWAGVAAVAAGEGPTAAAVGVHGRIDAFLVEALGERLREALRPGTPDFVVLDLHTGKGPAGLSIRLADAVHKVRERGVVVAALVHEPGSPATTLLALACDRVFMTEGARLVPIDPGAFDPPATADEAKELRAAVGRYCGTASPEGSL